MAGTPTTREGDWQCPNQECSNHTHYPSNFVYGSKVNCPKCGTGKTARKPGDWCCPNVQCINHQNTVYGSKNMCSKCGALKPSLGMDANPSGMSLAMMGQLASMQGLGGPMGQVGQRQGDWHCPNASCRNHMNNVVFATKSSCPLCGTQKPAVAVRPQQQQQYRALQQQLALSGMPGMNGGGKGGWPGADFGLYGGMQNMGMQNLGGGGKGGWPGAEFGFGMSVNGGRGSWPGDWHCPNPGCKNHTANFVYASKTQCSLCSASKPLVPAMGGFANGSRPGDWQCPNASCKNHSNFVYSCKTSCTVCGTARPPMAGDLHDMARSPGQ